MEQLPPITCIANVEATAVDTIHFYWAHLRAFLTQHLSPRLDNPSLDLWDNHRSLQVPFNALRKEVTRYHSTKPGDHAKGLHSWHHDYLLPLAQALNLVEHVETTVIRTARRRGLFIKARTRKSFDLPDVALLTPQVREIFEKAPFKSGTTQNYLLALTDLETGICPDRASAELLAKEWKRVHSLAAGLAQGAILDFIQYRDLGILKHANHPGSQELIKLEHFREQSPKRLTVPLLVIAAIRADVLALYQVLSDDELGKGLWDQNVLHWPQLSHFRQSYAQRLHPELQHIIAARLSVIRSYSFEQSKQLLEALIAAGLDTVWDFGCAQHGISSSSPTEHLERTIGQDIGALNEVQQHEIHRVLTLLDEAMQETGVVFSRRRMLKDSPYSIRRKRAGRGIWFGLPAIQKRKQRHLKKRKDIYTFSRQVVLIDDHQENQVFFEPRPEDWLAKSFAEKLEATEDESRAIIRDVWTHGAHGVLDQNSRFSSLPLSVIDFVHLLRLGHIDRSQRIGAIRELANELMEDFARPPLSMSVTKSLFYQLPKPPFWNGGQGPVVRGIHQQATQVKTVRQLHERWLLVPVEIPLPITGNDRVSIHTSCHGIVVIEMATERPMGAWINVQNPTIDDIGLALFTAIWHPGFPEWPLRGIPGRLCVPPSLQSLISNIHTLKAAARYLGFVIEDDYPTEWTGPRQLDKTDMIERLQALGAKHVLKQYHAEHVSVEQAQEGVLHFLLTDPESFPNHTPAPMKKVGPFGGLSLPGSDSPAAGWLLPRVGKAFIEEGGVVRDGIAHSLYGSPLSFGIAVHCRAFPYPYPGKIPGFFVETPEERLRFATA